jgi:hypothetical protein
MTTEELIKKVYERYPVKDGEKTCWEIKQKRDELRNLYRQRLINDYGITNVEKVRKS